MDTGRKEWDIGDEETGEGNTVRKRIRGIWIQEVRYGILVMEKQEKDTL